MKVLIIGNGGREHALAWKCAQDQNVKTVYVAPGNAGTANELKVQNLEIDAGDFEAITKFCSEQPIDLVIVGPEQPLVDGLSDYLNHNGVPTFGPSARAARLEASKSFSKDFFKKYDIPSADYEVFDSHSMAMHYIQSQTFPLVIKADGLAAGKGVIICPEIKHAKATIDDIFLKKRFGDAGKKVVIESFLEGEEASFIAVVSNTQIIPLATSQDHKAAYDNDLGPNTGGMGAYSPAPIINDQLHQQIMDQVMLPTVNGLIKENSPYLGFLYAGLMINENDINVLEFNCRFGDPETQPILMRMQSSLVELCNAAIKNNLRDHEVIWHNDHACGVVIAADGYPSNYKTGQKINFNTNETSQMKIFHAGTKKDGNDILTSGGRVLCATALGDDLKSAKQNAYKLVDDINFEGMHFRKDIGNKGIL